MSFNQQSWGRISGSANNDVITLQDGSYSGAPNVFSYISATDTINQIAAADYFLPVFIELNVNDLIYIAGTDGVYFLTVTTVSNVTVLTEINLVGGDVSGPSSAVDEDLVIFDGTTGKVIKDSGVNISEVVTFTGATVVGNLPKFSSTAGEIQDSGISVIAGITASYAGGGTSNGFTVAGLTTSHRAVATIVTSTNSVSVNKAVCTANTLTITFSADPGAATTVAYWAFVAP